MLQLLLVLSWFILGLSIALLVSETVELLLRNKRPVVAFWFSWLSMVLSFVAASAVLFAIGYTTMILHSTHEDEALCTIFGLKKSPNSTCPVATEHTKVNASDVEEFWVTLTGECTALGRLLRCFVLGICLGAILCVVVALTVLPRFRRTVSYKARRFRIEPADTMKNTSLAGKGDKGMKLSEAIIHKSSPVGMQRHTEDQHFLRDRWTSYASFGFFFCFSLLGIILLDYYVDFMKPTTVNDKCVPLDYVPLELGSKGEIGNDMTTGGLECLRSPFHIVSREEWMAKPPKDTRPLQHPVSHVVLSHTPLGSCSSNEDCIAAIRSIQENNMGPRDGLWDISANFLIARDGRAYEGRGWKSAADDTGLFSNGTLSVMFTGTSHRTTPTINQQKAFKDLIGEGMRLQYIAKAYKTVVSPRSAGMMKLYN